ncbi:MAG: hypothetical protein O3C43_02430 [Verrucomicrobia bacterium]|nr:hypothetical protein [Verrucomicrobiota bacterium]
MKSWLILFICFLALTSFAQPQAVDTRILSGPLLNQAKVKQGELIPADLVIFTESGKQQTLLDVIDGNYTVLVSGCLTCPIFHRTYPGVEAVYQDYKDTDGLQFFYVYKSLAHPEYNGYIQPVTLQERLAHVVEAKRVLGTNLPWLCDDMDNAVRHTLGFGPNTQMVIDPQGKIVHALGWSDGEVLRKELVKLVGDSDTHTAVRDLTLEKRPAAMAQKSVQRGKATSPVFNETLVPVVINAVEVGKQPLYVKPRVEVTPGVLQRGRGEMYLGFHLDPIHHVHWNNLAAPLQYELSLPDGVYMTPEKGMAEEVDEDADADPREFVIEITGSEPGDVFGVTVRYFACSDEEGWCVPVTQKYEVRLAADLDGGGTMGRSFNRAGAGQNFAQAGARGGQQRGGPAGRRGPPGGGPGGAPGGRPSPDQMKERILGADRNGDGKISENEAPQQMQPIFAQADLDSDGFLTVDEVNAFVETSGQRAGPGGGGPGQGRPGQARGPGAPGQRGNPAAQLMDFDANKDGKITKDELPEPMQQRFGRMDENSDGVIDQTEVDAMIERSQGGQERRALPPGRPNRDSI